MRGAIVAVVVAALFYAYDSWVPHHNHPLPSFRALLRNDTAGTAEERALSRQLQEIYPEDAFPGGAYAQMPFGETRYFLFGPADGRRIVLVHGIGPPCIVFKRVALRLAGAGFRVLLFDLFGRGYSESPGALHDENLYTAQLALLLRHVGWSRSALLGYSMGAAIAVAYTSIYPHSVDALMLVSPAGLMEEIPINGRIFSFPVVGELLILTRLSNVLMKISSAANVRSDHLATVLQMPRSAMSDDEYETVVETQRLRTLVAFQIDHHPGLQRSFLSTTRYFPFTQSSRLLPRFHSIGQQQHDHQVEVDQQPHERDGADSDSRPLPMPVEVVWGTEDNLIPIRLWSVLNRLVPRATLVPIANGGHNIVVENSTAVADALISFGRRVNLIT